MKKFIAVLLSSILSLWLSLMGAYNLDRLLSRQPEQMSLSPPVMLSGFANGNMLKLFLLFLAACVLLILWALISVAHIDYQTDMRTVVPDVKIPMKAGQGQYGTADFLDKRRYQESFATTHINQHAPALEELLAQGQDTERRNAD